MIRDEKKREIILQMFQGSEVDWKKQIMWLPDKVLDQALSKLQALMEDKLLYNYGYNKGYADGLKALKPKIDEDRLMEIIVQANPQKFTDIDLVNTIIKAIALKKDEWLK